MVHVRGQRERSDRAQRPHRASRLNDSWTMRTWKCIGILLTLLFTGTVSDLAAQPSPGSTTIKGVLTSIKGDVYMMQDLSGRFVQFRVDKNTQRERLVVPGERIEVQLSPDHRALTIKPTQ